MKTLSERYIEELYQDINKPNICEGFFDWLKRLFQRALKSQKTIKDRFGKIPDLKIKDTKQMQASKNISGKMEKAVIDDLLKLGFPNLQKMFADKKNYFTDKEGNEIKAETVTYVYTPEEPISNNEKYIIVVAVKAEKKIQFLEGYSHIINFEASEDFKLDNTVINDLFKTYIETVVIKENNQLKGVTIKYLNNDKDYVDIRYNNKTFDTVDETIKLMKMDFK